MTWEVTETQLGTLSTLSIRDELSSRDEHGQDWIRQDQD